MGESRKLPFENPQNTGRKFADASMEVPQIESADLQALLEVTPDLVVLTDGVRFLYMNKAAAHFLGVGDHTDPAKIDPSTIVPASESGNLSRAIQEIQVSRAWHGEILLERHDGAVVPFSAVAFEVSRRSTNSRVFAATFRDLSSQKAYELELESHVYVEELTGLANRRCLIESLAQALRSSYERKTEVGLIAVDIDRFKLVNETLGPAAGDRLLVAVSDRIQLAVRASDVVARLSGDEFMVMCDDLEPNTLNAVSERIREALSHPFTISRRDISLTVSIGIVASGSRRTDPDSLLQDAIAAIYEAKEYGGDRISPFDPVRRLQIASRLELEQELRKALRNREFELAYQQEVWLTSEDLVCLEALIRWRHPERGLVQPDEFISLAEETGLINPIGEWVITEACQQLVEWKNQGLEGMSVSVNISPRQLAQSDFPQKLHAILEQEGIRPNQINLEITESMMTDQSRSFLNRIHDLRRAGFTMIMDDFGSGYSSLSQLRTLPFSVLKIDKTFILNLVDEESDRQLVDAMIRMAHALGRIVIAEGVETAAHAEILTNLSCEMGQGWYFGKPISGQDVTALLQPAEKEEDI